MSMTAERKAELIKEYAQKSGDTGSPEVQIAIISERIKYLTGHLIGDTSFLKNPLNPFGVFNMFC